MKTTRLEAFSDAVIAIIMTIMVLEIKVPHTPDWQGIIALIPTFLAYILSFVYLAIYWNNHHHLLHATSKVSAGILWANMHLLFWLSLLPFATAWVNEFSSSQIPVFVYGCILFFAAVAYDILLHTIFSSAGHNEVIKKEIGLDIKGKVSIILYVAGAASTYVSVTIALCLYTIVAIMWVVPDRRISKYSHSL